MRLVGEQTEAATGEQWPLLHQAERAAKQCGGDETVLTRNRIGKHRRERTCEQISDAIADDRAHRRGVERKRQRDPAGIRRDVRKQREQRRDEQERRWIGPLIVAGKAVPDGGVLHLLVNGPVVGRSRLAIEHEAAGRPDIHEILRPRLAVRADQPRAVGERGREVDGVCDAKAEAGENKRARECAGGGGPQGIWLGD